MLTNRANVPIVNAMEKPEDLLKGINSSVVTYLLENIKWLLVTMNEALGLIYYTFDSSFRIFEWIYKQGSGQELRV